MELERLEKIKEFTTKIESFITLENGLEDNVSMHLKSKLKGFSEALDFSIKEELYEKYQKEREFKKSNINNMMLNND